MSAINSAIVARCAAALNAINAEFVIQADGVPLAQSPSRTPTPTNGKKWNKPNTARYKKWGYHKKVRDMTIGVPVAFVLPEYEHDDVMEEFVKTVVGYAKHIHGAPRIADWEVAVSNRTLHLARLF